MVNWSDPKEIQKDADVFQSLIYALFGVYVWELFVTSGFEWSLITESVLALLSLYARNNVHLPVFFFLSRYCIFFAFIGLIISFTVSSEINCGALYTFNSWTGNMSILCASTSLMLRTIALWERRIKVIIPLGLLCLGHWAVLYRGMFIVTAVWDPRVNACAVDATNPSLLNVTFFYSKPNLPGNSSPLIYGL
ncbi:hypothetical protein ONZ45_g19005 [Pleurotus djamor]|nr:hypothetical protein ONZ45_g19005 [Pleurotus djamor]